MSWLARIEIDMETALSNSIVDSYACHQRLWECFPGEPDRKRDFLSRFDPLEGALRLWLLAKTKPVCPKWCPQDRFSLKEIAPSFLSHPHYAFDLRANPTRCISIKGPDGSMPRHGKRVPLVSQEDLRAWLDRKGEHGGFRITPGKPLEIGPTVTNLFRKEGNDGCHGSVQFRGTLSITDSARFSVTYHTGIGSAKSFGYGMFLLAPITL